MFTLQHFKDLSSTKYSTSLLVLQMHTWYMQLCSLRSLEQSQQSLFIYVFTLGYSQCTGTSPLSQIQSLSVPLQRRAGLPETTAKYDKTRCNKTKQAPHVESGQGHQKKSRQPSLRYGHSHYEECQAMSHNINSELSAVKLLIFVIAFEIELIAGFIQMPL